MATTVKNLETSYNTNAGWLNATRPANLASPESAVAKPLTLPSHTTQNANLRQFAAHANCNRNFGMPIVAQPLLAVRRCRGFKIRDAYSDSVGALLAAPQLATTSAPGRSRRPV